MAEIPLATRMGTRIPNFQGAEIDPRRRPHLRREIEAQFPGLVLRAPETGQYNCHGMVFASRRTRIPDDESVELVLHEDGYARVADHEAEVGDLVIYRSGDEIPHSGVITEIARIDPAAAPFVRRVLSKWGNHAEYFHHPAHVPRHFGSFEIWTERFNR